MKKTLIFIILFLSMGIKEEARSQAFLGMNIKDIQIYQDTTGIGELTHSNEVMAGERGPYIGAYISVNSYYVGFFFFSEKNKRCYSYTIIFLDKTVEPGYRKLLNVSYLRLDDSNWIYPEYNVLIERSKYVSVTYRGMNYSGISYSYKVKP